MMKMVSMTDIPGIENVRIYSYRDLRSATEDFSPANKIGEGGFGSVFKVSWHALDLSLLLPLFLVSLSLLFFSLGGGVWGWRRNEVGVSRHALI